MITGCRALGFGTLSARSRERMNIAYFHQEYFVIYRYSFSKLRLVGRFDVSFIDGLIDFITERDIEKIFSLLRRPLQRNVPRTLAPFRGDRQLLPLGLSLKIRIDWVGNNIVVIIFA